MKKTETPTDIIKTDSNDVTSAINAELLAEVNNSIIVIREQPVIIDADVAALYGVETKRINEAVRNNPNKFPKEYMFELTPKEVAYLRSKISTTKFSSKSTSFFTS